MNVTALLIIALLLLIILAMATLSGSGGAVQVRPRRLMTDRERQVIEIIEVAVPECRVHAQVSMGAIMTHKQGLASKTQTAIRNRFDRKRIDYVLECRASGDVIALVELDDRTHSAAKDAVRDKLTAAAGYVTIRLKAGQRVTPELVRERLAAVASVPHSPPDV